MIWREKFNSIERAAKFASKWKETSVQSLLCVKDNSELCVLENSKLWFVKKSKYLLFILIQREQERSDLWLILAGFNMTKGNID